MRFVCACLLASLSVAAARADAPAPGAAMPEAMGPSAPSGLRRWLDPATAPFIPITSAGAAGAELRKRVAGFDAFGTRVSLELAPSVDAGKVFSDADSSLGGHLHRAIGLGVRGLASPYVVGYGQGRGAVFSGINYPF